jgi:uncharacterized protein (DUF983 family)
MSDDWKEQGYALMMNCPNCGRQTVRAFFNTPEKVCTNCEYLVRGL